MSNHLMAVRTALNHLDNGYFPTDEHTLNGITARLDIAGERVRIFDPCCGEGSALARIKQHLEDCGSSCMSFGVELDSERAALSAGVLDHVVHANIEDCIFQTRSIGLLFLNPPYGFASADHLSSSRTERYETLFFNRTAALLQDNGILVLIVPEQSLTDSFTKEIASHFVDVRIFKAGVDTYRQVVIFGKRPPQRHYVSKKLIAEQQAVLLDYGNAPLLGDAVDFWYEVPQEAKRVFRPICMKLDPEHMEAEIEAAHNQTLWKQFGLWFGSSAEHQARPPLCELGQWHTALALAAGQVKGIVSSADGRRLLVKGNTYKVKSESTTEDWDSKGNLVTTTTLIDRFVPTIKAIDLTPGSAQFGQILTIK